jgi:hypothetical protein
MPIVVAVREGSSGGAFIGFQVDRDILSCSKCERDVADYRLRYTADQQSSLAEHRSAARRSIEAEHPNHSDTIRIVGFP